MNTDQAMNNFYNEPPFAERLEQLSEIDAIPETVQERFVHVVVGCYIGNKYGVSHAAEPFYQTMIQAFSPKEIAILLWANNGSTPLATRIRSEPSCRKRFLRALQLIDAQSIPTSSASTYHHLLASLN